MTRLFRAAILLAAAVGATVSSAAQAGGWQCVTYARSISQFDIRGNANTWWGQASGRYQRGQAPAKGAILAFKANAASRMGHVAVVRDVVSDREVRIDHANWTIRGGVERDARAIDVSAAGDWSAVRVSYGRGMGTRVNPTHGFIYARGGVDAPRTPRPSVPFNLARDVIELAAVEASTAG